jgi:hypothetical protein
MLECCRSLAGIHVAVLVEKLSFLQDDAKGFMKVRVNQDRSNGANLASQLANSTSVFLFTVLGFITHAQSST